VKAREGATDRDRVTGETLVRVRARRRAGESNNEKEKYTHVHSHPHTTHTTHTHTHTHTHTACAIVAAVPDKIMHVAVDAGKRDVLWFAPRRFAPPLVAFDVLGRHASLHLGRRLWRLFFLFLIGGALRLHAEYFTLPVS